MSYTCKIMQSIGLSGQITANGHHIHVSPKIANFDYTGV